MKTHENNPFKFGTIVGDEYFTDRTVEVEEIRRAMQGPNHLVMISPRRFGKSSLVKKAVSGIERPTLFINLQQITGTEELAAMLLKGVFKLFPIERLKHRMTHFRFIPTISTNPLTDAIDLSFPIATDETAVLEDVMEFIDKLGSEKDRIIVVLDEFQDILEIEKGIDKKLRAMMQVQENVNYIFLGSQESMMTDIFERKKSPFYHFGKLMYLKKIPHEDFLEYVCSRLTPVMDDNAAKAAGTILSFTLCHPYYTRQLASQVWEIATYESVTPNIVEQAIGRIVTTHDYDYERLWLNFNLTDKKLLQSLCLGKTEEIRRLMPASTFNSSVQRLIKRGYVIRTDHPEFEDPFFRRWILGQMN